ncbi:MAG: hypothetical protein BIFFINMI_00493 [Phycisphaerae bacterium]|nr:hypothetical protein [Phycisphaerae bacterium]
MALQVLKDFEHAAVEKVRVSDSDRRIQFAAPLGDGPRGMWFHFKVAGGDGSPVRMILTNRDHLLGAPTFDRAVPVYRTGDGPWLRVDPTTCRSGEPGGGLFDGGPRLTQGFFQFDVPCGPGVTEVAYCYPFTMQDVEEAFARWTAMGRRSGVKILTLCRTRGGRSLRVLRIGTPARGRKLIWVLARQHSGEVPGSFAAEGLVEAILSKAKWAAGLRRRATIFVCPATDVDGVAEGMYGKDRAPVDFNRDWCAFPQRPEIRALRQAMDASRLKCGGRSGSMLAFIDLHAPGPSGVSFPVPPSPAWSGPDAWRSAWWLAKLIERFNSEQSPLRWANNDPEHIDWSGPEVGPKVSSTFHAACGLADHSSSIELSYNWQANSRLAGPDDWRRIGQSIARALEALCRGVKPPRTVQRPDPPFHLEGGWSWLRVPRQCNAKVHDDIVSVQADGPQGYAAVLFNTAVPVGRQRFVATAALYRTSHRKCPVHRLIFFFKDGVFTGEVVEQKGELGSQSIIRWRGPTRRKRPADAARLAVVIRNWPGTLSIGRPEIEPVRPAKK